jgi:glutathione synthase/RimK-type ligase-like ATP-grasp enzyme
VRNLIVLDDPDEWRLEVPGADVVSARAYIASEDFRRQRNAMVFNLCKSYRYQSLGYYVSLLAAARGHKPLPSVSTIQDLKSPPLVRVVSEDLDDVVQKSLAGIKSDSFTLSIYFGRNVAKRYDRLSARLFDLFQAPFLRACFERREAWELKSVKPISAIEIPSRHHPYVQDLARQFFKSRKLSARKERVFSYDLAILVNPSEELPPSNAKALRRLVKAASELGLDAELIEKEDFGRIAEFDALFIRETTAVNHHTYRFARRAKAEGLVVIDDPDSILKCTNKIYLSELLEHHKVRVPKTLIVHRDNASDVQDAIGFPCILKQPDSAFSLGVKKARNQDELMDLLESLWAKSDLVIAQEFVPTEFDWRIGIIDKTPIFACKYFMARNHWQILKQGAGGKRDAGRVETLPLEEAPKEAINVALKAANLIGDGLYGVDVKESGGKWYVIEVNDNPNIDAGYEDAVLKGELYATIARVFRDRIEKRKQRSPLP